MNETTHTTANTTTHTTVGTAADATTGTVKAAKPTIGIFVTDEAGNMTAVSDSLGGIAGAVDKLARTMKVDANVLKVATLLLAYLGLLLLINNAAINRGTLGVMLSILSSRSDLFFMFSLLSLLLLYFLAQWSKIVYFFRRPLNMVLSLAITFLFACGALLLYMDMQRAFIGDLTLTIALVGALTILAVAYCNNFLASLSTRYAQQYERANQDKVRAERFKSELITNVSHDIQTPLTSIINYTDLLRGLSPKDKEFAQKFDEYTEVLERKSARLKDLTNDLIEASKAATGNVPIDMRSVNLTELIWQVAGEFDDRFSDRNLNFVLIPSDEQFIVSADSNQLWRVLENLFSNMTKYSLEGTRTFAQLERLPAGNSAGMVSLSLKNTSAEPLEQLGGELTEQFIRGDKARNTEGSGLGLHIAKSLAELMNGTLTVQVSGDQFEVKLLLHPSPQA